MAVENGMMENGGWQIVDEKWQMKNGHENWPNNVRLWQMADVKWLLKNK